MAADDVTAQSIRTVQFREKVRGYHPADVDAFVASVGDAFERLERKMLENESRVAELESRASAGSEAEESLRRTLILAQRTADAAIQEAREESARIRAEIEAERDRARAEIDDVRERTRADHQDLRERLVREAHEESRSTLEQLSAERSVLEAEVRALHAHIERERERLRIYFADQLRRVEAGEPALETPPPQATEPTPTPDADDTFAADAGAPAVAPADGGGRGEGDDGSLEASAGAAATTAVTGDGGEGDAGVADDGATPDSAAGAPPANVDPSSRPVWDDVLPESGGVQDSGQDDDPFLTELRRAVTDEAPLGPREDEPPSPTREGEEDDFDLFAKGDVDDGRFGSRLRRRR